MEDEKRIDEPIAESVEAGAEAAAKPVPKKSKKKFAIVGGVLAVVVVAAVGFWVWHNDPSFCANPVCHDSMDAYVSTFNQDDGAAGVDKWGSSVSNTHAMLAISHKAEGKACLDCHTADIQQQIGEVQIQLAGSYAKPLGEVGAHDLVVNRHQESPSGMGDEFCLNEGCHNVTREELADLVDDVTIGGVTFNPHNPPASVQVNGSNVVHKAFSEYQCTDCHKSHRASTLACTQCHDPAMNPNNPDFTSALPEGWVSHQASEQLKKDSASAKA